MTKATAPIIEPETVVVLAPAIVALVVGLAIGALFIYYFTEAKAAQHE